MKVIPPVPDGRFLFQIQMVGLFSIRYKVPQIFSFYCIANLFLKTHSVTCCVDGPRLGSITTKS
uniref:Uncharacterized protein n=1 Tax=Anguilla anguilla TaxID=7936 RepID=A0A0E9R2P0_ANGAN